MYVRRVTQLPRNKYPEETRQKIMEVSLKLFLEKGYDETTVLDIIANLGGLTRGAFYHHFKSKEEVLGELFSSLGGGELPFEQAMQADVPNGLERLRLLFKLSLKSNTANAEIEKLTGMVLALLNKPRFFYERHLGNLQSAKAFASIIEEGMADGSIRKGNAQAYAEILMLMTNHWMLPNLFPGTFEYMNEKGNLMYKMLEAIGFPVLDDEIAELFMGTLQALDM
jgi:AcrR family transcriptional regulator